MKVTKYRTLLDKLFEYCESIRIATSWLGCRIIINIIMERPSKQHLDNPPSSANCSWAPGSFRNIFKHANAVVWHLSCINAWQRHENVIKYRSLVSEIFALSQEPNIDTTLWSLACPGGFRLNHILELIDQIELCMTYLIKRAKITHAFSIVKGW